MLTLEQRTVRWPVSPRGAARGVTERVATILVARGTHVGLGEWGRCLFCHLAPSKRPDNQHELNGFAGDGVSFVTMWPPDTVVASPAAALEYAAETLDPALRFALETALLSLIAQRERTSVAALLVPHPLPRVRAAPVVDTVSEARIAVVAGSTALKLKIGPDDFALARDISRAVPGVRLRIDANRRWPRAETHARLESLRDLPIDYVEEPCEHAHLLLADRLPCPIALDESLVELDAAAIDRALAAPSLAALVLKPTLLGGFARCLDLAARARGAGKLAITSHFLEGPIGTAACIELARAIGCDAPVGLAPHPALDEFAESR